MDLPVSMRLRVRNKDMLTLVRLAVAFRPFIWRFGGLWFPGKYVSVSFFPQQGNIWSATPLRGFGMEFFGPRPR